MIVGGRQVLQHLIAFKLLCQKQGDKKTFPNLTEELIQCAHLVMMQGLKTEQGKTVNAGCYRKFSVYAGQHVFPFHECIPANMWKSTTENLLSHMTCINWRVGLHHNVVFLHPFEDGNGRISRLCGVIP